MCVSFGARDIYEFIFSSNEDTQNVFEVKKRSVRTFCSVLKQEITAHSGESPHYEFVHFALDRQSIAYFFESNRNRFLDFGTSVVFIGDASDAPARQIEQKYNDPVVTAALRKARSCALQEIGA